MNTMYLVGILGFVACAFAYKAMFEEKATGLKVAFIIIFVFLALRYDFGNDYRNYIDGFEEIAGHTKIFLTEAQWEPGWRFLHVLFKPFGFFAMVATIALFNCIVYYRLIRRFVPPKYYWLAVFIYVLDPYLMLVHSSMMRQALAILFFLLSIDFLVRRRPIGYFICILLAMSVHKSGIVLLPLFALGFVNFRLNKMLAALIMVFYICMFVFNNQVGAIISMTAGRFFPQYAEIYSGGTEFGTGLGMFYIIFEMLVILYYAGLEYGLQKKPWQNEEECDEIAYWDGDAAASPVDLASEIFQARTRRVMFLFAVITFLFIPMGLQLAMVGRLNYYFTPLLIVVWPIILHKSNSGAFKLVFLSSFIPFTLFRYWAFFHSPIWYKDFSTYQTIFSASQW